MSSPLSSSHSPGHSPTTAPEVPPTLGCSPSPQTLEPSPHLLTARLRPAPPAPPQEMLAIMKSIYDMMGRHTFPILREDAPLEHVERFFQVSAPAPGCAGKGGRKRKGLRLLGQSWACHSPL